MEAGGAGVSLARPLQVLWCLLLAVTLLGCSKGSSSGAPATAAPKVFRVVRSKQLTALAVVEKQRALEAALKPLGVEVRWLEFAAGPQQMEAVNAGELDLALTAESPPAFAQAADGPVVYLAHRAPSGKAVSCLVAPDSDIRKVADLRGKRVTFQKASIGHYLLMKALAREGLAFGDVQPVYLPPPDAQAAFSERKVDAWLIWEPFGTRAVKSGIAKVLFDGEGLRDSGDFYTTHRKFYEEGGDILKVFFAELKKAESWSESHPKEMAELLTSELLIDVPTLLEMHQKYTFGVFSITPEIIGKQQAVADLYYSLKFLPKKVDVKPGFLTPAQYSTLLPP
ncbi:MAG: aliphatic sulfonate ABC transporter substrate-binding protein [Myxococcales bacterium]|nr:MAG: aliphatic sulfonate ABC transporter substrate-binding protein [Myxococcales bacterium]